MADQCLQDWANNIRFELINDPARKQYQQRIQVYGFDFLDSYLDNVLQQDNVLDILKTPGRRKASPKKKRAPSKLREQVSEHEEKDDTIFFSEGLTLQKRSGKCHDATAHPFQPASPSRKYNTSATQSPPHSIVVSKEEVPPAVKVPPRSPSPIPEQKDLSIIAEDDESAERSPVRPPLPPPEDPVESVAPVPEVPVPEPPAPVNEDPVEMEIVASPIISPKLLPTGQDERNSDEEEEEEELLSPHSDSESEKSSPIEASEPAPAPTHTTVAHHDDTETFWVPLKDEAESDPSQRKAGSSYQSLPAPQPFRKSTRVARDPSMPAAPGMFAPVTPGLATTPGAALTNKRTSWLSRVREAKASKPGPAPNLIPRTAPGLGSKPKRKSTDIAGMEDGSELDEGPDGRKVKLQKTLSGDKPASFKAQSVEATNSKSSDANEPLVAEPPAETPITADLGITALKKRMEDIGNQRNKPTGKSLGDITAANIRAKTAEARAAVLASLAGPEQSEALLHPFAAQSTESTQSEAPSHPRLSISELSTNRPASSSHRVSTTPPHSPPPQQAPDVPRPVFSKPPPVFSAPSPKPTEHPPSPPTNKPFSVPSMPLGLAPRLPSPRMGSPPRQVPKPSSPRPVFSKAPASAVFKPAQSDPVVEKIPSARVAQLDADDDSWPMDETNTNAVFWTNVRDDTWSTQPTVSQKMESADGKTQETEVDTQPLSRGIPGAFDDDIDMELDDSAPFTQVYDLEIDISKPTVALVQPKLARSQSQTSMTSNESSASSQPVGFFGHATKFVNSVLGTGKKVVKTPAGVKSLQLAAAAAKKHQEEEDKKASRLKEMENRRQQASQRKAEEEKARALEEEKRIKEEGERRKREREETTEKRPLRPAAKKEEDTTKKRKLGPAEPEKKEIRKIPSKQNLATSKSTTNLKAGPSKAAVQPTAPAPAAKPAEAKVTKPTPLNKGKAKAPTPAQLDEEPTQQRSSRSKTQAQAPKQPVLPPSEAIELPEINSEYSDSEDEDRKKTFDPPSWAQGDEFINRLQQQSRLNPDDIFGAVRPLRMEEIFRSRTSRFRARTSSANWSGTDRLTVEEEREYARRMGYL